MMPNNNVLSLVANLVDTQNFTVLDPEKLRSGIIDSLVEYAVFGKDDEKTTARWLIWNIAISAGVIPASIEGLYLARGQGKIDKLFTVPAINIRTLTFDFSQTLFSVAKQKNVGAVICEIARSEMGYTDQSPEEYSICILAGAIKAGWKGPVFIQGDHFQVKAAAMGIAKSGELEKLTALSAEAMVSGFYNIDIDASTLVDLSKISIDAQQRPNIDATWELAGFIRSNAPQGVSVSVGGEIGHIGGKNSTLDDFKAFMGGLYDRWTINAPLLSKVSVQTGTSHGGVIDANGHVQDMHIDLDIIKEISDFGRAEYGIGGAVQHGASTLPDDKFHVFPNYHALEIHLATGFQNLLLDHPKFPQEITLSMHNWLKTHKTADEEDSWSDEQFYYRTRKKAMGAFKQMLWHIDAPVKKALFGSVAQRLEFLFGQLGVEDTLDVVQTYVKTPKLPRSLESFGKTSVTKEVIEGISG